MPLCLCSLGTGSAALWLGDGLVPERVPTAAVSSAVGVTEKPSGLCWVPSSSMPKAIAPRWAAGREPALAFAPGLPEEGWAGGSGSAALARGATPKLLRGTAARSAAGWGGVGASKPG